MPSYDPVIKNGVNGAIIPIGLLDALIPGSLKAAPTLAAGDFKIEIDGGTATNLTNLPTVTPAGGTSVKIILTQAEINGDNLVINCIDQTNPKEWTDAKVIIQTAGDTVNLGFTVPAIGRGTVTTGASSTSIPTSAFTPAGASLDQFAGRVVLFDANTTTPALRGCARAITSSSVAAAPTFTVVALPGTPVSGDSFSVV
jgi:hypothetical protein